MYRIVAIDEPVRITPTLSDIIVVWVNSPLTLPSSPPTLRQHETLPHAACGAGNGGLGIQYRRGPIAAAEIPGWTAHHGPNGGYRDHPDPVRQPSARQHMGKLFGPSVTMGTLHFGLMFVAIENIHVGTAALIIQTSAPFALLLALIFFRETFGWRRAAGIVICFLGVTMLVGEPRVSDNLPYAGMALISALAFGAANLQLRALGDVSVFAINGWMAVFAIPQMALMAVLFESGQIDAVVGASTETWVAITAYGNYRQHRRTRAVVPAGA